VNQLISELSRVCKDYLLQEKWLLAPSLRIGHQWLDSVTVAGQPAVNVRIRTLKGLALELAGPEMARLGVSPVASIGAQIIACSILGRLQTAPSGYLASLSAGPTLAQTLAAALNTLRLAGFGAAELDPSCFEAVQKGNDLVFALREYQSMLQEKNLVDYAEVLHMAEARLADHSAIPKNVLILVPEDLDLVLLERRLLKALPGSKLLTLSVDRHAVKSCGPFVEESDANLLRWMLCPAAAPPAREDGTAEIFRAFGERNEVRQVLRTCILRCYRLDHVELLHTDAGTYIPLIYESFVSLMPDGARTDDIPVTFAEGIPARYSRPGRGLIALIGWIRDGYPQTTLARMIQDGLLEIPGFDAEEFSLTSLASAFRRVSVRSGRDSYAPALTEAVAGLESPPLKSEAGRRPKTGRAATSESKHLKILLDFITSLLEICPAETTEGSELLRTAAEFLERYAARDNQLDSYSLNALLAEIREMLFWTNEISEHVSLNFHDWLTNLPGRTRVCGSGPRPGCMHVAHVLSGGHSGRIHTFIIGLDDGRFPGVGLNDPLLLDQEREKLSPDLPKSAGELGIKLKKFAAIPARLRGTVTLGFSCHNFADDREIFANSAVFSAYRLLSNNREGDQGDMLKWLPPAASFAPESCDACLDESEWWLWRLCGEQRVENASEILGSRFPHLRQGIVASRARAGADFTVYDGLVPEPPPELDPCSPLGPAMSASMLETIGRCALNYFFKYVLELRPPNDLTPDGTRWLDPLEFGNLLHEVFYRFMRELMSQRRSPLVGRDRPLLVKILHEQVDSFAKRIPPPNSSAFRRQIIQLTRAADIFLIEEEELCRSSKPVFLEAAVGMRPYDRPTELDTQEPVIIPISGSKTIRARGRIDRIDLLDDASGAVFSLWDYKTGSPLKYDQTDIFAQGRIVQHALYMQMAAAMLRKRISVNAEVRHFGYFFPGTGAKGVRIVRRNEHMDAGKRIIEDLCETVARGCFIATENYKEDCRFCDYLPVCGDVARVADCVKRKLQNPANVDLGAMRALRNRET